MSFIRRIKYRVYLKSLDKDSLFYEMQTAKQGGDVEKMLLIVKEIEQREAKGKI